MEGRATTESLTIGVLSDTHGHLYAEVGQALAGVDHIIHAGDIGSPRVLMELAQIAPLTAVRGNCDHDGWAQGLPVHAEVELGGVRIVVGHVLGQVRELAGDAPVVVSGHSHLALIERHGGTLYLNPGSAGPRRFERPRSVALLTIGPARSGGCETGPRVDAEIVTVPD